MEQPQMNPSGGPAPPPKKTSPWIWLLVGCAAILIVGTIVTAGFMWWGYHKAKDYVKQNLDTGQMNKVALWSDVPPLQGMEQKNDAEMPMAIRVLARPFLDTLMRGLNNGKNAGHYD